MSDILRKVEKLEKRLLKLKAAQEKLYAEWHITDLDEALAVCHSLKAKIPGILENNLDNTFLE